MNPVYDENGKLVMMHGGNDNAKAAKCVDCDIANLKIEVNEALVQVKSLLDDMKTSKSSLVKDFIFDTIYEKMGNIECLSKKLMGVADSLNAQCQRLTALHKRENAFHKWQVDAVQRFANEDNEINAIVNANTQEDREQDKILLEEIAPKIANELCADCQIPEAEMSAYCNYPSKYSMVPLGKLNEFDCAFGKLIAISDDLDSSRIDMPEKLIGDAGDEYLQHTTNISADFSSDNSVVRVGFQPPECAVDEFGEPVEDDWCVEKNLPNALSLISVDNLHSSANNPDLSVPLNEDMQSNG